MNVIWRSRPATMLVQLFVPGSRGKEIILIDVSER